MAILVEVCAGSVQDCITAEQCGAHRIELNSALHLGGLTPSVGQLIEAKKNTTLPIITMLRPRGGGFLYSDMEIATLFTDGKVLLEHGADGLVFGFLNGDGDIDVATTRRFVDLAHAYGKEAIFHRAFDCVRDVRHALEALIDCGVDRILTSGQQVSAADGMALLQNLYTAFGERIEFCVGAGVNKDNVVSIITQTGIKQVHSSFKTWYTDPTTVGAFVSYAYAADGDYEGVGRKKLEAFIDCLKQTVL